MRRFFFTALVAALVLMGCKGGYGNNDNDNGHTCRSEMVGEKAGVNTSAATSSYEGRVNSSDLLLGEPLVKYRKDDYIIYHRNYIISYNVSRKLPNWVAYAIDSCEVNGSLGRADRFEQDPLLGTDEQPNYYDFSRSGYDRGHMAPSGDMRFSQEAMNECFYLTNICPQNPDFNGGVWRDLEVMVRRWTRKSGKVYVVCGPIVGKHPQSIGKGEVTVPDQFFKVLLKQHKGTWYAIAYLFPNQALGKVNYNNYAKSVDEIEQLTGCDFFYSLPNDIEKKIEGRCDTSQWCGKLPKR